MSFSYDIKEEICNVDLSKIESIAELSAIVRNNGVIDDVFSIVLENDKVAGRVIKLFKDIYDVNLKITVRKRRGLGSNLIYILDMYDKDKREYILEDLSIIDSNGEYLDIPHEYLISDEDTVRSYLMGLFMTSGSVNDPKKSRYHLEFVVNTSSYAKFVSDILNSYYLNSKVIRREKSYMVYVKEAEKIGDFLRIIRAYSGVMYFEDIRIYRDHMNMTNRLNNCEQANMDKVFMTASRQIRDIKKLEEYDMLDVVSDKIREVIDYRLKYPESSLGELADIMSEELGYNITKSGLNHRFRKIREMVLEIEKNKN